MIKLHYGQSQVYRALMLEKLYRFLVVVCSRGWGKSYGGAALVQTAVFELMAMPAHVPNKRVYVIAPTYEDVTDIYYPVLAHDYGLEQYALASSRALGRFKFPGNVELRLLSYEAVERIRGKGK